MYLEARPAGSSEECPLRVLHLQRKDFPCKIRDVMTLALSSTTPDYEGGGPHTKRRLYWFVCEGDLATLRSNTQWAFEETLEAWNNDPDSFDLMRRSND